MTSLVVVLFVLCAVPRARLPLPIGTATIRGHVVRTDGPPLARAEVRLLSTDKPGPPRVAMTDESGGYEFATLPAGRYTVTAGKTGYVALEVGQDRAFEGGPPVLFKRDETRGTVCIWLAPYGRHMGPGLGGKSGAARRGRRVGERNGIF